MNKKEPPPRSRREATQFEFVFGKRHEIDSDESSDEDTSEVQYNNQERMDEKEGRGEDEEEEDEGDEDNESDCLDDDSDDFDSDEEDDEPSLCYDGDNIPQSTGNIKGFFSSRTRLNVTPCAHCTHTQRRMTDGDMSYRAAKVDVFAIEVSSVHALILTYITLSLVFCKQKLNTCELMCKKKNCMDSVGVVTLGGFRRDFWGSVPTGADRRVKIQHALSVANKNFNHLLQLGAISATDYKRPFLFRVGETEVCEKAFVNLLGLADIKGHKPKTWLEEVSIFFGTFEIILQFIIYTLCHHCINCIAVNIR
jgi:hypothetical protein